LISLLFWTNIKFKSGKFSLIILVNFFIISKLLGIDSSIKNITTKHSNSKALIRDSLCIKFESIVILYAYKYKDGNPLCNSTEILFELITIIIKMICN